ncbi:hypothetical protein ALC53_02619 [Atta colombica]|uniref:Uncharacterized protein n=1 Tax=Atta colombica TaxID=520822 RepID=A0A195BRK9_9HYME|nr:hypothetical protein ALC53_02619 [Atta colombica]
MLLPEVRLIFQRQTRSNRSHSEISRILKEEEEEEADKKKEKETSWLVVPSQVATVYFIGNSRREKSGRASVHCVVDESCPGLPEESNEPSRFMFSRLPFFIWLWPPAVQKPIGTYRSQSAFGGMIKEINEWDEDKGLRMWMTTIAKKSDSALMQTLLTGRSAAGRVDSRRANISRDFLLCHRSVSKSAGTRTHSTNADSSSLSRQNERRNATTETIVRDHIQHRRINRHAARLIINYLVALGHQAFATLHSDISVPFSRATVPLKPQNHLLPSSLNVCKDIWRPRSRARRGRDPRGSRAETRAKTRVNRRLQRHAPYLP